MSWDKLPVEIKLRIAQQLDFLDYSSMTKVSRSCRYFIERNAYRLPKLEMSSLQIEQHDYRRFKHRCQVIQIRQEESTQIKKYFFRTDYDLWLFLQFIYVNRSLYLGLLSNISLEKEICKACESVDTLTLNIGSHRNEGPPITVDYLIRLCEGLPNLETLDLNDGSADFDEDVYEIISKIKMPNRIEVRSNKSSSKLKIGDNTLQHLATVSKPLDVVVLSTNRSAFSLDAVRTFLENVEFDKKSSGGYVELYKIDCTTNEFFKLLTEMNIQFASDPIRSVFNSFPVLLNGKTVCINVKYFSDSNSHGARGR